MYPAFQSSQAAVTEKEAPGDAAGAHGQAAGQPRAARVRHRVGGCAAEGFGRPQIRQRGKHIFDVVSQDTEFRNASASPINDNPEFLIYRR